MLQVKRSADEDLLALLENNVIGTPGASMVYQHLKVRPKIWNIRNPYFVNLERNHKILGTCCFCERHLAGAVEAVGYYIRYFTFLKGFRLAKSSTRQNQKRGKLREEISQILDFQEFDQQQSAKVIYGYIDPENSRSMNFAKEFDFEVVRKFVTYSFSRWSPKNKIAFERIEKNDLDGIYELLKTRYSQYTMYQTENLFFEDGYFVVRDAQGEILAGAQASKDAWQVFELGGKFGKFLIRVLSSLPLINKLFNRHFKFAVFDYLYARPGFESHLEKLLESVLKEFELNTGILAADHQSDLSEQVKRMNLGPLNSVKKPTSAALVIKTDNNDFDHVKNNPTFISTLDFL